MVAARNLTGTGLTPFYDQDTENGKSGYYDPDKIDKEVGNVDHHIRENHQANTANSIKQMIIYPVGFHPTGTKQRVGNDIRRDANPPYNIRDHAIRYPNIEN